MGMARVSPIHRSISDSLSSLFVRCKTLLFLFFNKMHLFPKMMAMAEWEDKEEGKEITQQWEDDWDDDDVNDDFSLQLRRELENNTQKN